jgi:hypothetical protein
MSVHNELINKLIETGIDGDFVECEASIASIAVGSVAVEIYILVGSFDAPNIGVRETENMLAVSFLDIGRAEVGHFCLMI